MHGIGALAHPHHTPLISCFEPRRAFPGDQRGGGAFEMLRLPPSGRGRLTSPPAGRGAPAPLLGSRCSWLRLQGPPSCRHGAGGVRGSKSRWVSPLRQQETFSSDSSGSSFSETKAAAAREAARMLRVVPCLVLQRMLGWAGTSRAAK